MSDRTTEIREGLEWIKSGSVAAPMHTPQAVYDAARAYADLLDNGPDYEAALEVYATHRPGVGPVTDRKRVKAIVDAALAAVVDTPKENQ